MSSPIAIEAAQQDVLGVALVVDDSLSQRLLTSQILFEAGFNVLQAKDGQEAIDVFTNETIDFILMDIQMPVMDGIEATKHIRSTLDKRYVPIIFISGGDSNKYLNECVQAGGDDFITKPCNPVALIAKAKSLMRLKALYDQQHQQRSKLEAYQEAAELEHETAAELYTSIVESGFHASPVVKFDLSPMSKFNGDMLLCAYTPSNKLHLLLGDFTGHGITASVAAAPTAEIFYGMSKKGFGIMEICQEINHKLNDLLPSSMFLAATALCLDQEYKNLSLITCGLPDHFLYSAEDGKIERIVSNNLPMGIVSNEHTQLEEIQVEVQQNDQLIMFTDGVIETTNQDGVAFDYAGVGSAINDKEDSIVSILDALAKHQGTLEQQDDITLVELKCDLAPEKWQIKQQFQNRQTATPTKWRYSTTFYADTLKRFDPVPMVVNTLMDIQGLQLYRESIFLVVTELFLNGLEHGLLSLDSTIKRGPDGFANYFELKHQRLNQLADGCIQMKFQHVPNTDNDGGALSIMIQDTGDGFDSKNKQSDMDENDGYHGRGIALIEKICESLTFSDHGRRALAVFKWQKKS